MDVSFLIWIPLLPLIGAAINLTFGPRLSRGAVHFLSCSAVAGSLLVSAFAVFGVLCPVIFTLPNPAPIALQQHALDWITAGTFSVPIGFYCDALTSVMLLVITFVGLLIHVYSTGYMHHDPGYARFFGYLNLFTGAMLILVLGDSLPVLFIGWEGVGLCSYLLIGFWYDKDGTQSPGLANATAGKKAFIVNRVGDFAFLLGMFLIFSYTGTLNIQSLQSFPSILVRTLELPFGLGSASVAGVAALMFFIGATGKSAQIPLYVWLPDAMAGPTPVSALIHAATMVTAGVYMVARLNILFMLTPAVMGLVALVGACTAVFAATIGFTQRDIKKVLAYSTVSQLGYMFLGVGVGAFSAGVFHLFTHAFFKACLFLGAGAVIHALHEEQDILKMGGLKYKLPVTRWTFLISTLAISGIVPFAGFFSKDEILWRAITTVNPHWGQNFSYLLYSLGLIGAMCTAFYMFRLYTLVFSSPSRMDPHTAAHVHEAPPSMGWPLIFLALGATLLGFLGLPEAVGTNFFAHWLAPVVEQGRAVAQAQGVAAITVNESLAHSHALEWGLMALSLSIAAWSCFRAFLFYREGPDRAAALVARMESWHLGGLYRMSLQKYKIDELYDALIVRPVGRIGAQFLSLFDQLVIDGLGVKGTSWVFRDVASTVVRRLQNGSVQHYIVVLVIGLVLVLYAARMG